MEVRPGEIVSKTLAQNDCVSITLFAFDKGEEIGTHDSTGDAMVTVLEGAGSFTVGGEAHIVKAGETLVMPAKFPIQYLQSNLLNGFSLSYFQNKGKHLKQSKELASE